MFLMSAFVILAFDILFLTFSFWHSLFGILFLAFSFWHSLLSEYFACCGLRCRGLIIKEFDRSKIPVKIPLLAADCGHVSLIGKKVLGSYFRTLVFSQAVLPKAFLSAQLF